MFKRFFDTFKLQLQVEELKRELAKFKDQNQVLNGQLEEAKLKIDGLQYKLAASERREAQLNGWLSRQQYTQVNLLEKEVEARNVKISSLEKQIVKLKDLYQAQEIVLRGNHVE